jgi:hypothetical protein
MSFTLYSGYRIKSLTEGFSIHYLATDELIWWRTSSATFHKEFQSLLPLGDGRIAVFSDPRVADRYRLT